jgi:hypothetical protein
MEKKININTKLHHCKVSWLMLFTKNIYIYSENNMKIINTLHGQNAELLNVKTDGTHGDCFALNA